MKMVKYLLIGLGGLLALGVAAAAVFALTFDPNRYRDEIERIAKERTGRTLKLQGPLEVAFFPSLGAKVAGLTFSERASERQFLALDSAHASVKLMPLLRGELIVDRVQVAGLKAEIVKDKNGRYNFDDLLGGDQKPPAAEKKAKAPEKPAAPAEGAVKFDIAGVDVERSALTYRDLATGRELQFSELKLATGRLAERAEGHLLLQTRVAGKNPSMDARVDVSGDYRVDLPAKSFAFAKVDGTVKGTLEKDAIEAKLSAPRLEITADKAAGEAVNVEFRSKGPQRTTEAKLKLSGVQGSAKALTIPSLSADIALSGADFPQPIKLPVTGSLRADLEKQTANADVATKFDESSVTAKLGLAKFSPPAYTFDVNVDKLNVDRYFPDKGAAPQPAPAPAGKDTGNSADKGGAPPSPGARAADDGAVDFSAIKDLNATGRLQVGALQVKGLKLANVKAEVKAANGRMDVAPHSANLYEGAVSGALSVQANGNRIALKESLTNVAVGPLLRDAAKQDRLEGRGNVSLDVTGAGATVDAIKKSLAGAARVSLRDGAIKGIDIGALLNKVKSLGKSDEGSANSKDQTQFSELNASFAIKNGVATNKDLEVKAPLVRIGGAGDIDIGNSTMNYVVKASLVATSKGQGGAAADQLAGLTVPVKLSGPFDALKYQVDYGAAAAELAKSKVGEKIQERVEQNKGKIEDKVRDRLKGLLGR